MTFPNPATINAWTRLLRAHAQALAIVEASLKVANMPKLAWYDVLLELERVNDAGIRPYELQEKLLLPQYGLSRLVERIERAGYLRRKSSDDDGRGQLLFITPAGRQIRKHMWSVYGPAIEQAIATELSPTEVEKLSDLLGKLSR